MITLDQVRNVKFGKSNIGGYKPDEVDNFITRVEKAFEYFEEELQNKDDAIQSLEEEIKKCKEDEVYIKDVLVSAKKTAELEIQEAKRKADLIINEAVEKSKDIVCVNDSQIKEQEEVLNKMKAEVINFKTRLLNEYKSHLKAIGAIEREYTKKDIKTENEKSDIEKNEVENNKEDVEDNRKNDENTNTEFKEKFARLGGIRFGDNYDIKNDEESPIKLFN